METEALLLGWNRNWQVIQMRSGHETTRLVWLTFQGGVKFARVPPFSTILENEEVLDRWRFWSCLNRSNNHVGLRLWNRQGNNGKYERFIPSLALQ